MLTPIQNHNLKTSESHSPIDAPMPVTTEQELFNKSKKEQKTSLCGCFKRRKTHSKKLTRYENDDLIISVAKKAI